MGGNRDQFGQQRSRFWNNQNFHQQKFQNGLQMQQPSNSNSFNQRNIKPFKQSSHVFHNLNKMPTAVDKTANKSSDDESKDGSSSNKNWNGSAMVVSLYYQLVGVYCPSSSSTADDF